MTQTTPERYLRSYYFSFEPTGNDAVDAILEAVCRAGKAYHSTESWGYPNDWNPEDKSSHIEKIQNAANEAARKWGAEL